MRPASDFIYIQLSNSREKFRFIRRTLRLHFTFDIGCAIFPSLTVENQKNRCIPCISWSAAIFAVVTKYSILFPSFAFFLNSSHFAFG